MNESDTITPIAFTVRDKQLETKRKPEAKTGRGVADLPLSLSDHSPGGVNLLALNQAIQAGGYQQDAGRWAASRSHLLEDKIIAAAKRVFDAGAAAFALLGLLPILALCAVAIRVTSPGPLLFRQKRLGRGGQEFSIFKFRTMVVDAEARLNQLLATDPRARDEWDADHKLRNDPRVTSIGGFLRRFSLDELPQFWNVLLGDMSMVGPRPIVKHEVPRYREAFSTYAQVRPGITGLWQVSGRNDTGYAERISLDCRYVQEWSPMLDLQILMKTFGAVISSAGAY